MYCRRQLVKLQDHADEFAAKNASIVAIVVDPDSTSQALATKLGVRFPILRDKDLGAIRSYGVEHVGEGISLPATFVIGADGVVQLAYVGDAPRDRPKIKDLLAAL
ncbi:MAG: peroxiredoxin family protein [Myxococcota bacterium]